MPARVVPVFQIYSFGDFASKNPQINGRSSGALEKLQALKSVKPRLQHPFHLPLGHLRQVTQYRRTSVFLSVQWVSCEGSGEIA